MQAIKCPNCGSEKCKEISEEKWICLACDNVFLIHNLSKEFTKTDKHIAQVHSDLKEEIAKMALKNDDLETQFQSALSLLERNRTQEAKEIFEELCHKYANSYKGWYGKFQMSKDDTSEWMEDVISNVENVLRSEDAPEEIKKEMENYLADLKDKALREEKEHLEKFEAERQEIIEQLNERNGDEQKEREHSMESQITRLDGKIAKAGGFGKFIAVLLQIATVVVSLALAAGVILALGGGIIAGGYGLFTFLFGSFDRAEGAIEGISSLIFGFVPRLVVVVVVIIVAIKLLPLIFRVVKAAFGKGKNAVSAILRALGNMNGSVSELYRQKTGVDHLSDDLQAYREKTENISDRLENVKVYIENRKELFEKTQSLAVDSIDTFKEWAASRDNIDSSEYILDLYDKGKMLMYKLSWEDPTDKETYDELAEVLDALQDAGEMTDEEVKQEKGIFSGQLAEEYQEYREYAEELCSEEETE